MDGTQTGGWCARYLSGDPGCAGIIVNALKTVAAAVTPPGAPGRDAADGHVGSLTEAVMGVTAGLCRIADALESVAEAIRETRQPTD